MALLDKVRREHRGAKQWSQPPFWAFDETRLPFLGTYPLTPDREKIEVDYESYARDAYKANGIVFALIATRQMVFAEARFLWRELFEGRPGRLFRTDALELLESPWPGGTTGELLGRMEVTASLAGNYYGTTADDDGNLGRRAMASRNRRIVHMRPDWVTIVVGSRSGNPYALDAHVAGYLYEPRPSSTYGVPPPPGRASLPTLLLPNEVIHYSPLPDPQARFRGMSWLTPLIREVHADKAATVHKGKFFENGAVPNMVVKFDKDTEQDAFDDFVERYKEDHQGAWNAYKTLYLSGGADVQVVGADFRQMDFSRTQGKGESRIAAAAGVPPSWVGFSEGLQGSALNSGNYNAARRRFADGTMRPLWRMAASSLSVFAEPRPSPSVHLWYDDRDIPFLRVDARDAAEISRTQAVAIRQLTDSGFEPDAAVEAVLAMDLAQLTGKHSGLFSVQLRPPQSMDNKPDVVRVEIARPAAAAATTAGQDQSPDETEE